MKKFKTLPTKKRSAIVFEVKLMLAAHRDCLWTQWNGFSHPKAVDPTKFQIVCNDGYYGEAFGVMRALVVLGYGYFGSDNLDATREGRSDVPEHNIKWWFDTIQKEYLQEEGYYDGTCSAEKCQELLQKYRQLVRK